MFHPRRGTVMMTAGVLAAAAVVMLLSATARVHVTQPPSSSGYALSVGWPFDWLHQQSSVTPPLPFDIAIGNPINNPTGVDGWAFGLDVLMVGAALLAIAMVVRPRVARRSKPLTPAAASR